MDEKRHDSEAYEVSCDPRERDGISRRRTWT